MNNLNSNRTNESTAGAYQKLVESDRQKAIKEYFDNYKVPRFIKKGPLYVGEIKSVLAPITQYAPSIDPIPR